MLSLEPFSQLDPTLVQQSLDQAVQQIQEDNPDIDVHRGVLHDLLAYYHAVLAAQQQTFVNQYLLGRSLKAINQNAALADPDLVDDVLSNYNIARQPGTSASGEVTVVVSRPVTVTVAQNSVWQAGNQVFLADNVFTAKTDASQLNSSGDRLLTATADGNWAFTINVTAQSAGAGAPVLRGSLVTPTQVPPGYVTSYATSDFATGLNPETNSELLPLLQQGVAAKTMGNRTSMAAMLRQIDAFSRVVAMSIVGYGDPEMLRDKHTIFPVAVGGRVDWYVRSTGPVQGTSLTKTCTLVAINSDGTTTWQASIGRDDASAFFEIRGIQPSSARPGVGGFQVVSDVRGCDFSDFEYVPDIFVGSPEVVYSRFQTAVIQFTDTLTPTTGLQVGATASYTMEAVGVPLIDQIQDTVSGRQVRSAASDCLVKAPVPCFVSLGLTIYKTAGQADPDLAAIGAALCSAVNAVGFTGRLYMSDLQDVIAGHLQSGMSSGAIDALGRIRYPNGGMAYLRSREVLAVPNDPTNMVSPRTVQFFASPTDVVINTAVANAADA